MSFRLRAWLSEIRRTRSAAIVEIGDSNCKLGMLLQRVLVFLQVWHFSAKNTLTCSDAVLGKAHGEISLLSQSVEHFLLSFALLGNPLPECLFYLGRYQHDQPRYGRMRNLTTRIRLCGMPKHFDQLVCAAGD